MAETGLLIASPTRSLTVTEYSSIPSDTRQQTLWITRPQRPSLEFERCRHVAIDVDRLTVEAIAGKIGNVVLAIKLLHSSADSVQCAVHHQACDVPLGQFEFFVRGGGMT